MEEISLWHGGDQFVEWRRSDCGMKEISLWHGGDQTVAWRRSDCGMKEIRLWHGGDQSVAWRYLVGFLYAPCHKHKVQQQDLVCDWLANNQSCRNIQLLREKRKWLSALQWHSARARQHLIPNHILLNVQLFDSLLTVAVSVDVHSTAESVVQSVIQQKALTGGVSDYQLWVLYDGEEEMHPLIGHELPYCILLYWLRGQRSQHTFSTQQWHSADELRVTDDNNTSSPRFLLKTRTEIHTHTYTGSLKHKRKRSLIGWALRKGHVQSEGQNDLEYASNKLFGQSLASICHDGNLPKEIMDMLCVLYHQGPETLGIFRRSANAKICRILKEKLNLRHPVSFRGESVFVSASLLTEFLRKLPGSVLGCDLYEDWMNAMETEDQQSRCSSVTSVLAKLPQINRTLLCYVFGVLHRIHTHSDVNQMTASNLALCVAPNILWRATSSNPEEESQRLLQVVALVRFLIENAPSIFGDEAEDVFTTLLNAAQQNNDLTADSSLPLHSSSEETDLDFFPSSLLSSDLEPFLPLRTLSLCPLTVATETTDSVSSCGTLDSSPPMPISLGELRQSRDRCLSEPLMCFDTTSPSQAPPHPSVIRQSSCDNAVMDNKISQSQSPVLQGRGRGVGKGRYAFWKSPQFPARFRHPAQRLASMSSLSSTTTSSLSSLDSFEYTSSPSDDKPRPFLFGTSARLRPLTPEMPRKLWTMAYTYDELKDKQKNEERDKEKDGECQVSNINIKDECKENDDQDGEIKEVRDELIKEKHDGEMQPHSCPTHKHTLHTHSLTLPSKPDRISRLKITLFPSVGRRMFKQSGRVAMETEGVPVTMAQVNIPQTLFYNQNVNLVFQSDGSRCKISDTGEDCTCHDTRVSKATEDDANHDLSKTTPDNNLQSEADVSQIVSDISDRKSFNQSAADVSQSDNRISIKTSTSTGHKISINLNDSIQCDAITDCTVNISSIKVSQSASASTSHTVSIADVHGASQSINTPGASISRAISGNKIDPRVSISPSNANQNTDAPSKTSIRQTIRIRLPATVRNSVRAYFSPGYTLTRSHSETHTHSAMSTQTHTLPKSQTRPLCTSKMQ
ncbi:hypothetical protein HF521_013833 [Silurus meridionalis]|uniref:Rho GTPase-activating protein 20-like n=2 Tax=Silurus meridionalis TaxID=175797 RepID=A0A8T0AD77_SILME|nr:hypothetical protein HF521_013833 [Silurus meridionalis]